MVNESSHKNFCIVGIGDHCKKNIIPALKTLNKKILGIVTTQLDYKIGTDTLIFSNIDSAINNLPKNTVFLLSTPPKYHIQDILKVLKSDRNVYVEKPAFVESTYLHEIEEICFQRKLILVELFMYKYTKIYKKFIETWYKHLKSIKSLEIKFYIPSIPKNTFRENLDVLDTAIYDIGCYPLSLMAEIDIDLTKLNVKKFSYNSPADQSFVLSDNNNNIKKMISFGVGYEYQNYINIKLRNNKEIIFKLFFYGKSVSKSLEEYDKNTKMLTKSNIFLDNNGFEKMLDKKKNYWFLSQNDRFKKISDVTKALEKISLKVKEKLFSNLE